MAVGEHLTFSLSGTDTPSHLLILFCLFLKTDPETNPPLFHSFLERGDLDFVEQLWVRLRKSESVPSLEKPEFMWL